MMRKRAAGFLLGSEILYPTTLEEAPRCKIYYVAGAAHEVILMGSRACEMKCRMCDCATRLGCKTHSLGVWARDGGKL